MWAKRLLVGTAAAMVVTALFIVKHSNPHERLFQVLQSSKVATLRDGTIARLATPTREGDKQMAQTPNYRNGNLADLEVFSGCLSEKIASLTNKTFPKRQASRENPTLLLQDLMRVKFIFEHHICRATCVGYIHVFKSAGTFAADALKQYCQKVSGKKTATCFNMSDSACQQCGARTKYFTVIRDPIERFFSSTFEALRRKLEDRGGLETFFASLGKSPTKDQTVLRFLQRFVWSQKDIDPHLKLQTQYLNHHSILDKLHYVIPYSSSGAGPRGGYELAESLTQVIGDLFVKPQMGNWSHSDSQMYEPVLLQQLQKQGHARNRENSAYSAGEKHEHILGLFRRLHPTDASADVLQFVKKMYFLDRSSLVSCGYKEKY